LVVDGDAAVELPANTERADLVRRGAGRGERTGDRGPERSLPERGILLCPTRARELRAVGRRGLAADLQLAIGDRDLEALRTDIDADDHRVPQQQPAAFAGCGCP